jgi:hypothetical protein
MGGTVLSRMAFEYDEHAANSAMAAMEEVDTVTARNRATAKNARTSQAINRRTRQRPS